MSADDIDRGRIASQIADRARHDFQLRTSIFDREQAQWLAAASEEEKKRLRLTAEHHLSGLELRDGERDDLERGIEFFSTFSLDVLEALQTDLLRDGNFSYKHGISRHDGDPEAPHRPTGGGIARFVRTFKAEHTGERYIRDFFTYRPAEPELIHEAWAALRLKEPIGLTEVAAWYSREAIHNLLIVANALNLAQINCQARSVTPTGDRAASAWAYRTGKLRYLTAEFSEYLLTAAPTDEFLASDLATGPDDRFGLTLEGLTKDEILESLQSCRSHWNPALSATR